MDVEPLIDAIRREVEAIREIVAKTDQFIRRFSGGGIGHKSPGSPGLDNTGPHPSHKPGSPLGPRNMS